MAEGGEDIEMDNFDGNEFDTPDDDATDTDNLISQEQLAPPVIEGEQGGMTLTELQMKFVILLSIIFMNLSDIQARSNILVISSMMHDGKLYFIKDKQRISLSNEKEKGKVLALSTIHGKTNVKFIRGDLGIMASKKSRAALLDEINPETTPAQDLSKSTTYVHEIIETISQETQADIQYIRELGLDKAMQTIVGARKLNTAKITELK